MTKAINELTPAAIPHIDLLIKHANRVESAVRDAIKRERFIRGDPVQPCNPAIPRAYRDSIPRAFALRGFPDPGGECYTDVPGVKFDDGIPEYNLDELYNAAFHRGAEVKKRINEVALRLINNFTRPEVPFNFTYNTTSAQCSLTPVCMYRVGQFWHQELGIHSHGLDDHVPDRSRKVIFEFFRVVNGELGDNLLMRLPKYDNGSVERVFLDDTTTMIQSSRAPYPSCFRLIAIEENPAMIQALDEVDHFAQQAEDAFTSSNLAILLLPLALTVVPISLFTDVSTRFVLLYTLMSDVLTVIPLGIKGTEMLIIGSSRFRTVITRMTSGAIGNITSTEAAAAEIWGAECRVRDHVQPAGIALITTAVVFLVIGVSLELGTWAYSKKRQRAGKGLLLGSSRRTAFFDSESDPLSSAEIAVLDRDDRYLILESSYMGLHEKGKVLLKH